MTEKKYLFRFSYVFNNGAGTMDINLTGKDINYDCLVEVTKYIKDNLEDDIDDRQINSIHVSSWSRIY